ncbi:MAG: mismatch repair protein [Acidobacteria bacterium]|nr:mismatch repair protein [Acidobacteriota bacterium]
MSDPKAEYSRRLESDLQIAAAKNRVHIQIGNLKLAVVAIGLVLTWFAIGRRAFSSEWLWAPIATYFILALIHQRVIRTRTRAETAAAMYRRGIDRIDDHWAGTGRTGERFRDPKHVYADDLDLFGRGCLFELLSTARLPMGENQLASWLKTPSTHAEILERQKIVAELRDKLDLQRDLGVMGEELGMRLNPEMLVGWAEGKREMPGGIWHFAAILLALAFIATFALSIDQLIYWPVLCVLVVEVIFRRALYHRAHHVNEGVSCNAEGLVLFADVLQRLERETFSSARLQTLMAELQHGGVVASRSIRQLAQIEYWIDAHHSLIGHLLELPLLYSIQVAFAAEWWRRHHGARMRASVATVGEIEALLSLATYSYEHPADLFPEFVDAAAAADSHPRAFFHGVELGHPLIAAAKCVRNSVRLDDTTRVLLVSGSNMSGKSTLLRSVGINTVLVMAGAPVRARSLRLSALQVGTRIHSSDSLQEGRSTFFAEILHIRRVFDLAGAKSTDGDSVPGAAPSAVATERESRALLFLFDELLEGTNSKDRRIGAERLIHGLLERGAIGIVTTHDLALTEITSAIDDVIRNVHFEDQVEGHEMRFDYRLRDGVVTKSNAIALMRIIGLEM